MCSDVGSEDLYPAKKYMKSGETCKCVSKNHEGESGEEYESS